MSDPLRIQVVVLASRNRKKRNEIAKLLAPHGIQLAGFDVPDVVEDGETFAENAAKKAGQTAKRLSHWTIGEDSGLAVDALGGAPGVYSARYSGENADDNRNNRKLLDELSGKSAEQRGAHYVCHVALADPSGEIRLSVEATCRGRIALDPRGTNGFGYDPLFLIPEYHRTFGQLGPAAKRHLSHRARAFERFIPQLTRIIHTEPADPTGAVGIGNP